MLSGTLHQRVRLLPSAATRAAGGDVLAGVWMDHPRPRMQIGPCRMHLIRSPTSISAGGR